MLSRKADTAGSLAVFPRATLPLYLELSSCRPARNLKPADEFGSTGDRPNTDAVSEALTRASLQSTPPAAAGSGSPRRRRALFLLRSESCATSCCDLTSVVDEDRRRT
ncbi:hypothetical protein J5N97_008358 [Dioscorea zingiberensis]|uniref:Uncharacterized protein n=1 Tax=Dioscorea zingiberensis TaxID=325984 RepID=A0A9D5HKU4_9LILI|nr:hypothetical protein J5N97_008358 [Dioscorea zingiberensis]